MAKTFHWNSLKFTGNHWKSLEFTGFTGIHSNSLKLTEMQSSLKFTQIHSNSLKFTEWLQFSTPERPQATNRQAGRKTERTTWRGWLNAVALREIKGKENKKRHKSRTDRDREIKRERNKKCQGSASNVMQNSLTKKRSARTKVITSWWRAI